MFQVHKHSRKLMTTTETKNSSLIEGCVPVSTTKYVTSEEIITLTLLYNIQAQEDKAFNCASAKCNAHIHPKP